MKYLKTLHFKIQFSALNDCWFAIILRSDDIKLFAHKLLIVETQKEVCGYDVNNYRHVGNNLGTSGVFCQSRM